MPVALEIDPERVRLIVQEYQESCRILGNRTEAAHYTALRYGLEPKQVQELAGEAER